MNEKQKVEWYFNQGVNRPSDKYYISYHPVTFEPILRVKIKPPYFQIVT